MIILFYYYDETSRIYTILPFMPFSLCFKSSIFLINSLWSWHSVELKSTFSFSFLFQYNIRPDLGVESDQCKIWNQRSHNHKRNNPQYKRCFEIIFAISELTNVRHVQYRFVYFVCLMYCMWLPITSTWTEAVNHLKQN